MHGAEGIIAGKAPIGALPQHLTRGIGAGLAAMAAQWLSLALWDHALDFQVIWLSGPLLLALLLCSPYKYWMAYGVGWILGMLSLSLLMGLPAKGIATINLAVALLITLAAWTLSHVPPPPSPVRSTPPLPRSAGRGG